MVFLLSKCSMGFNGIVLNTNLVTFQKSFSAGDIGGEFVGRDQSHHRLNPGAEIAVVAEEALQIVGVEQLLLASVGFGRQLRPLFVDLFLFAVDRIRRVRMALHQPRSCFIQLTDLFHSTHSNQM